MPCKKPRRRGAAKTLGYRAGRAPALERRGLLDSESAARDAKDRFLGRGGARSVCITIHEGTVSTRTVCR